MGGKLGDLTDAELERLSTIIEAGKHLRTLRDQKVGYEKSHRLRMNALDSEITRTGERLGELRAESLIRGEA